MDTTSKTMTLRDIFRRSSFTIPEIQRDYSWDAKKEVSKLLEDLWKYHTVTDKETHPHYFIGTVIVYESHEGGPLQIMDGQQRISSLTCLLSAIKTILERYRNEADSKSEKKRLQRKAEKLEDDFLFEINKADVICKLSPKSEEAYKVIRHMVQMDGQTPTVAFVDKPGDVSGVRLLGALSYFFDEITTMVNEVNPEDPLAAIEDFFKTLSNNVVATLTKTTTIGMAFQMFVSVNGQGKPLNSYDLLRGLLVAKSHSLGLERKVSSLLRKLSKTMSKIGKDKTGDTKVENCVRYWTESRNGKNILNADVPDYLDHEIRDFIEFIEFKQMITELERYAFSYLNICDRRADWLKSDLFPSGYMQNRRILGFNESGSPWNPQHMVIFTALHSKGPKFDGPISGKQIDMVMEATEWVNVRGGWSRKTANSLENIFPIYANKALYESEAVEEWIHDYIRDIGQVLDKAKSEGIEGFSHLRDNPISESKATVLLHKVAGSGKDPGPLTRTENCNACPLLPTGSPPPWRIDAERQEQGSISGMLGNWFLLRDIEDKTIAKFPQGPKARVKEMLKNANTSMEKVSIEQIKKNLDKKIGWKTKDIRKRNAQLLKQLDKKWPVDFEIPK